MRGLICPVLAVRPALAGEQLRLGLAVQLALIETVRMHPRRQPCVLQMHVDDITDEDAMRLDRALMPESVVFLCAPALGVLSVIPLEVGRGSAGMCIILPRRDEQVQVRLLARAPASADHERHR